MLLIFLCANKLALITEKKTLNDCKSTAFDTRV